MSHFTSTESSFSGNYQSKHYNMKQFINAARDYTATRAEETVNLINRHLQVLSVTIDLSTFDPHTSVVCEFFVSLHELLSNLEARSALAWCCVNVLSTACRNSAARNALIHTYEFLPPLSRLLGDHLTDEKKERLLTLMQELTCGIKISWSIPYLKHLMSTLTKWVYNEANRNDRVISLSLGVLVNLCYKNLPAVYMLTKCVDIKTFVRKAASLQGIEIEVHICKLLIILDHMYGKVPLESLIKLTEVTFKSINEAFKARNVILLRHIIEFYLDIKVQDGRENFAIHYEHCDKEMEKLLDTMTNNISCSGDANDLDPECVALTLQFLQSFVELKMTKLIPHYEKLVQISLQWVQAEMVSSQALIMLRTIAMQDVRSDVLEPILNTNSGLSILLIELEHKTTDIPTNLEYNKKLSALMQLLLSLLKVDSLRDRVLGMLKEEHLYKIFMPLLGDESTRSRASDVDTSSPEAANLYVISLALTYEMARHSEMWNNVFSSLMHQKQLHMIMAQAMHSESTTVRSLILNLAASHMFPRDAVAAAMGEMQPMIPTKVKSDTSHQMEIYMPSTSSVQSEKLDEILNRLREACTQNTLLNSSTSDVMELYEYKLASMGHAERAAMASVEAASQRCTHLQHRISQLTAELSRTHQLLFHSQQCQGDLTKDRDSLVETNKELNYRLEAQKGRNKALSSQLSIKEKLLQEKQNLLEETTKRLKEVEGVKSGLETEHALLKSGVSKLEENMKKLEKAYEEKKELLNRANSAIEHLKTQVTHKDEQLLQTQVELSDTRNELAEVKRDLLIKKQIIDTITKLANSNTS